jgi:flavin reductase (DIM6/NTAB) family NADH-FMN oxidoreductase RutF
MRQWATGVTIVTSTYQGVNHGMTVSSFTSVSLEPPLVLVCLEHMARTHDLVQRSGIFGVTILAGHQEEISNRFAGRETENLDRFENLPTFTLATGAPFLQEGLATFDCRVVAAYEAGTHTIFIGDVVASQVGIGDLQPLVYYNRSYYQLNHKAA